jgi:hypothetical protein
MASSSIIRKKRNGDPDPVLKTTLKTKRTFVPGDFNPPGKPVVDRETTPELGKKLGEPEAKTKARMSAQASGSPSYDYKGKKEYAGKYKNETKVELSTNKLPVKTEIKKVPMQQPSKSTSMTMKKTSSKKPGTQKKFKATMKRRLPRVEYLQGKGHGRNKRTEAGHGR